jgi:putative transport protein
MIWKFYAVSAALSWSKRASVAEDLALVLPILTLGLLFFRMPFDEVAGIFADACGNPAILVYSNKLTPIDRADIGYAMIFPDMTIVKNLFVDIVPAFF